MGPMAELKKNPVSILKNLKRIEMLVLKIRRDIMKLEKTHRCPRCGHRLTYDELADKYQLSKARVHQLRKK